MRPGAIARCLRATVLAGLPFWARAAVCGALLGLVAAAALVLQARAQGSGAPLTAADFLLAVFGGAPCFGTVREQLAHFPLAWVAACVLIPYLTLGYPLREMRGYGVQVMVATGSRWAWWLAACVWAAMTVLLALLSIVAACGVASALWGACSWEPTAAGLELLGLEASRRMPMPSVGAFLGGAAIALAGLALAQLALSAAFSPAVGFLALVAAVVSAVLLPDFVNPLAGLMGFRSGEIALYGADPRTFACAGLAAALLSTALGGAAVSRMDMVDREEAWHA